MINIIFTGTVLDNSSSPTAHQELLRWNTIRIFYGEKVNSALYKSKAVVDETVTVVRGQKRTRVVYSEGERYPYLLRVAESHLQSYYTIFSYQQSYYETITIVLPKKSFCTESTYQSDRSLSICSI